MNKYLIRVYTTILNTNEEYYAESDEDLTLNDDFIDICESLAYENYQSYSYLYSNEDYDYYDTTSDEFFDIESERYDYDIKLLSEEEYKKNEEYYKILENIWD